MKSKIKVLHNQLLQLYNQGIPDSEIIKSLPISLESVRKWRLQNNFLESNRPRKKLGQTYPEYNVDKELVELYNKGYNDDKIARILKIASSTVGNYRKRLNLPAIEKYIYEDWELSDIEYQVIVGGLMGDSCFYKPSLTSNSYGKITHCTKQKQYLIWKSNLLSRFTLGKITESYGTCSRGKLHGNCTTMIKAHPILNNIQEMFYPNRGKKVIPKQMYDKFDCLALAVLYMDDGSKTNGAYTIATMCFTTEDVKHFRDFLKEKFNLNTTQRNNNILYIKTESADLFRRLIGGYIVPCMQYKL